MKEESKKGRRSEPGEGDNRRAVACSSATPPDKATAGTGKDRKPEMRPGYRGGSILAHGRWSKGVSGNPAGRPKGEPLLTPELKRQLRDPCPMDPLRRPWLVVIIERTMQLALKGNPAALKEVWERIDGRVKENLRLDIQLQAIRSMSDVELERVIAGAALPVAQKKAPSEADRRVSALSP